MALALVLTGAGAATGLSLYALSDSLVFFHPPADFAARPAELADRPTRLGGLVEKGSVTRAGTAVRFRVTDGRATLPVVYTGALPDLFREGQGVVAEGRLGPDGVFAARTLFAKHDERYMPPEVARSLAARSPAQ